MAEPGRYRKKPVQIEAMRFDGSNQDDILSWASSHPDSAPMWVQMAIDGSSVIVIRTLEGEFACPAGWWILRGVVGEFYGCRPDVFEQTYEAVDA